VYRGGAIPDLRGTYFFGDYCGKQIYTGTFQGDSLAGVRDRTAELAHPGITMGGITSFGEDARGELYICDQSGQIFKIIPSAASGVADEGTPPAAAEMRVVSSLPSPSDVKLELSLPHGGPV
jgi:hypothetical protein